MIVTSSTGSFINILQAGTMGTAWSTLQSSEQRSINSSNPKAVGFGSEKLLDILNQTDCIGIRIYHAYESGNKKLMIIGVNSSGDDMLSGYILDMGRACPPDCGTNGLI